VSDPECQTFANSIAQYHIGVSNQIKIDFVFREEVANARGVGFNVQAALASIEPDGPKIEAAAEEREVVIRNAQSIVEAHVQRAGN
jgi:hypothetical protein